MRLYREFLGCGLGALFFSDGADGGGGWMYGRITEGVLSFSRGWMMIHNPETEWKVTNELSTMEFSIAMLASGGWTNKEIAEHIGISVNTVKHYLTNIFCKLNVKKRDELKKYMLK